MPTCLEVLLKKGLCSWIHGVYDTTARIVEDPRPILEGSRPLSEQLRDWWRMGRDMDRQRLWDEWFGYPPEPGETVPWTGPEMLAAALSDGAVTKDDHRIDHLCAIFRSRDDFLDYAPRDGVIEIKWPPEEGDLTGSPEFDVDTSLVTFCEIDDILVLANHDRTTVQIYAGSNRIW